MSHRAMPGIRLLASALGAILLLATAQPANARTIGGLFEATVPASGATEPGAFQAGLLDVLVRVTGRRDAATIPELARLIEDAARFVTSYRRIAGGQLAVAFDGDAVTAALADAGMPYWGADRPLTLVWLAVDRGGGERGLVTAAAASGERQAVERAAAQRGLPLVWPSIGPGREALERLDQVRTGEVAALVAAAVPYGAQGVLIGRASRFARADYAVDWTFVGTGNRQGSGGLEDGVHLAADHYAALYASPVAAQRQELDVTVTGVDSAAGYAEVVRHFESLDVVRALAVREVGPDAVVLRLSIRGDAQVLARAALSGGRLEQAPTVTGEPVFRLRP